MKTNVDDPLWDALGVLFQSHPWHGVSLGPRTPEVVTAYIEIVPTDAVKYEIDKVSGLLRVDRPQKFSNVCPTLYGLLPQTLCATRVAKRASMKAGRLGLVGDGDPLDICVLTERPIQHGNILVDARPIGGLRMLDGNEADDKIIAVLEGDPVYGALRDVSECPKPLLDRLRHYFLTYKQSPDEATSPCEVTEIYGRAEAHEVIARSQEDYAETFGGLRNLITAALSRAQEGT